MSRGLGATQHRLLAALEAAADDGSAPPLAWFERRALGFETTSATRSSVSRAAVGLQRAGFIERGIVAFRSDPSTNLHYRHARVRLHPDDVRELWLQGERLHSVVRLTPTPADQEELEAALARWRDMPRSGRLWLEYAKWLFEPGEGIWPDDPAVIQLSTQGSLDEFRRAVSEHALALRG